MGKVRERREGGCDGGSLLFMLSVGHIDRLHQSPALEHPSGGGRAGERGARWGSRKGWGGGQEGVKG